MIIHILPGDAYVDTFRETGIEGEVGIFRECFVEGDLSGDILPELWQSRESFLSGVYTDPEKSYPDYVVSEIKKFSVAKTGDEVNLWFEYELFCSVNFWFCLHLLKDSGADIYRVAPTVRDDKTKWRGFGRLDAQEMIACWNDRVKLTSEDVKLGSELWLAFKAGDFDRLRKLGSNDAFPYLKEVTEAAAELETRPKEVVQEIITEGSTDFNEIFPQFARRAGVYGLGDVQVKRIVDSIIH